ncbi:MULTISPECIES: hypothetical protein [Rhodopirellula]|uniref:hypothetical protein n=1 Tax=Rhodopirellula TaxID=265488 RepID=UPI00258119D6|nr:hypothetical protein [Rhodopirellula sp. UBA1907]
MVAGPRKAARCRSLSLIHVWPRLLPDHPYYVPLGYSAPDNLSPGHSGEHYSEKLPDPVIYPVSSDSGATSD